MVDVIGVIDVIGVMDVIGVIDVIGVVDTNLCNRFFCVYVRTNNKIPATW